MQTGHVLVSHDLAKVLCLTEDRKGVRLVKVESTQDLNQSICLTDLTEAKNIHERLKDAGLIGSLEIINIARLYKKFY
jgi:hypothetical protein